MAKLSKLYFKNWNIGSKIKGVDNYGLIRETGSITSLFV
jgi:hypothetical protein